MNQYLKTIGDLLQQNERLAQQEREVLLKAIADADKQWSIIDFKLERTEKVKRTTTVLLEETIAELDQKRKAIEEQNRELEIEGALERVRSVAMGMKKPEDMLDVCKVISQQLSLLNVKEIRNVQTAIFYDEKGFYANYEYYAKHDKLFITDTEFRNHPVAEQFASQMMKGPNEVFIHSFSGKEVRDWLGYQKSTNVFIDSYLETASSLNYYWYSLGPVALGMSTYVPLEENEIDLFKRFRNVFELAYRRYLDIEKAEAQAKEAQIEAALERVRARTMAMHKSEDLGSIALELFRELLKFGGGVNTCGFVLCDRDKTEDEYWVCWESGIQPPMLIPHTTDPTCINLYKGWEMGEEYYVEEKSGEELKAHFDYLMTVPSVRRVFENWLQMSGRFPSRQRWHAAYFKYGFVFVITDQPYPEEQIFKRFAPVFGQAYTRFLDLKKAEAQAKEAKIEAALEKVRARTMGMQRSDELADTAVLLFQQLKLLDVELRGCGFNIWEKDEKTCTAWMSTPVGELMQPFSLPLTEYPLFIRYYESRKNGEDFWVQETSKKELSARLGYLSTLPVVGELLTGSPNNEAAIPAFVVDHVVNFSNGNLIFITYKPYPEAHDIFKRFGKVFDQTYTRFLDLQKAETQAREAQVEAALEKVRSRSLAMHKSDELEQVVTVVNEKLRELGVSMEDRAASMIIFEEGSKDLVQWVASQEHETSSYFRTPYFDHPIFNDLLEAKEKGVDFFYKAYTPKVKNSYFRYFFEHSDYKLLPDSTKKWILESEHYALSIAYAKHSALAIVNLSGKPLSENQNDILKRFSRVFEQSYTRFLDLQKAEAQAKESQIQLALERVRARTMAMHQSAELIEVLTVLMQQLNELKFDIDLTSIHPNFSEQPFIYWMASVTRPYPEKFDVPYKDIPFMKKFRQAAQLKKEVLNIHFEKKEKDQWINHLFQLTSAAHMSPESKEYLLQAPSFTCSIVKGTNVAVNVGNYRDIKYSDADHEVLRRFASVFEQSYTRFLDLQKAEGQAREAQIEAALEKVRSRTLAMQRSEELAETAAVLFKQLILLGIEPNRLYICTINGDAGESEFWITDEDGSKVSSRYEANLNDNSSFKKMYDGWRLESKTLKLDMEGKELHDYFEHLTALNVPFKGGLSQKRRLQYIAYFSKGFIGMASPDEQPEETIQLLERFAGVFNLTFTRFNDLKVAEAHAVQAEQDLIEIKAAKKRAEDALTELQATQKQLVQSEKMASLGELTAGIAHEIQNPLNFVNNFSDVSNELLDEMKMELKKGNADEAMFIAEDVKQNLEKILFHGKRADGIVKSMLQHSRVSSGKKEPTDINALCEEYLRLAYHGLRAKDKSFNAKFETHLDKSIEKINVIPQDIGRVFLNLINNAFYAVTEKRNQTGDGYEPTVIVRTKNLNTSIEITVQDNGSGIPQKVLDKIFQPFFTTKPTGEGTGLGLSLSYDIITKGHSGAIKVKTNEGEGTEFAIQLPTT